MRSSRAGTVRRLYKSAEDQIGPLLPRPLRQAWRRLIGRPPLEGLRTAPPEAPAPTLPAAQAFDVVCFPIIAWSFRFQRPQHLMRELGTRGHRVFWLDPESVKQPAISGLGQSLAERVWEVALRPPAARDPFRDTLRPEDVDALLPQLERLHRDAGLVAPVAIVQLPFWAPLAFRASAELGWTVAYDCMDDHAAFSTNDAAMVDDETRLLSQSAMVVVTSERLRERAEASARRVVSVPNACDFDHFAPSPTRTTPAAVAGIPPPRVGYIGAISEWFDFDLLRHAVATHPEWSFVLVGSTWGAGEHGDLLEAPNVHFLGEQPYEDVPALLASFDVATIPFQLTPLIEATDPVKLYEYQAAQKPVVASRLPELRAHAERVSLVDTPEEFTAAIERELASDSPERRVDRAAFAQDNTWAQRAAVLDAAMERTFPTASICVVTWNNLDLTRACLDSVLGDQTWPNLEVLVVDNASSDETPRYLQDLAAQDRRVKITLNEDNRGFAAANNQALRAATGTYLCLLNNDTVVPPGWLARLIQTLDADPTIGLVGPVTDGVWNEARVDGLRVPPDRVSTFAARWARDHAGAVYPIGMLAMYCVVTHRRVVDEVGLLDERFGIGMFEDDDYAHRIRRAGYRLACAEEVFVHHAGQASFDKLERKDDLWEENRAKFETKWGAHWRAPGLGTRARTREHQREIERFLSGATQPPLILLPGDDGLPLPIQSLADLLAADGHHVIEVCEPEQDGDARQFRVTGNRARSTLPLEAFDSVTGALVFPCAARTFDLAFFREARMVYLDEPSAPEEARRELLERAEIILGGTTPGAIPTDQLEDAARRLRQSKTADA